MRKARIILFGIALLSGIGEQFMLRQNLSEAAMFALFSLFFVAATAALILLEATFRGEACRGLDRDKFAFREGTLANWVTSCLGESAHVCTLYRATAFGILIAAAAGLGFAWVIADLSRKASYAPAYTWQAFGFDALFFLAGLAALAALFVGPIFLKKWYFRTRTPWNSIRTTWNIGIAAWYAFLVLGPGMFIDPELLAIPFFILLPVGIALAAVVGAAAIAGAGWLVIRGPEVLGRRIMQRLEDLQEKHPVARRLFRLFSAIEEAACPIAFS